MLKNRYPLYQQLDAMGYGPTCLRMVAKYYGRSITLDYLRNKSQYGKEGVSMRGLANAAGISLPDKKLNNGKDAGNR